MCGYTTFPLFGKLKWSFLCSFSWFLDKGRYYESKYSYLLIFLIIMKISMKKCAHCVSSHFKKHGMFYALGFSLLIVAKWIISLALWIGFFSLSVHASYDPATVCANITDIPQSECYALVDFYNATDGDNRGDSNPIYMSAWLANGGWLQGTEACLHNKYDWRKWVTCWTYWDASGRVVQLNIVLQGDLASSAYVDLSGLPYLQQLRLENMWISAINLTGLSGLLYLDLAHNALTSLELPISGAAYFLNNGIDLSYNQLESVTFPQDLSWQWINLSHNNLTEIRLPESYVETQQLFIGNNPLVSFDLTGFSLTHLQNLDIEWVSLSSQEFSQMFSQLPNITYLNLSGCWFSDFSVLSWLNELRSLNLSNNNLSGIFDWDQLPYLDTLYVSNNNLEWINLSHLNDLLYVDLSYNQVIIDNIALPEDIEHSSLYGLNLNNNNLSGVLDVSAYALTNLNLNNNHLTQVIMNKHEMGWLSMMNNNLTTFDFRWFDNYQWDFWIWGNQYSGTLDDMGICDVVFTGGGRVGWIIDCRNAYNMWESVWWCHKIQLDGMGLYGDIPECLTWFRNTLISLNGNYLSLYNSSGELKYSPELVSWLNDYSVWDSQWWSFDWKEQNDTSETSSDLYIFPSVATAGTISKWSNISVNISFGNIWPFIVPPGSVVTVSLWGLVDVVSSRWTFQTSWWVAGDQCYEQFLRGTWVYVPALDEWSDALVSAFVKDNGDGTVTVSLGEKNTFTFVPSYDMMHSSWLNRYFYFLSDLVTQMWADNQELFQLLVNTFNTSWAQSAFDYMCKAGVFNNGEWFATMGECLESPWSPNSWTPIQLSGFAGCGISSLSYTVWGMASSDKRSFDISATVDGDISVAATVINAWTELNLWSNYSYLTMNLWTQKVVGSSWYVNLAIPESSEVIITRDSMASASGGSVEVPADMSILVSGDWNGALYAPMDTDNSSCDLANIINKFSVWATGDSASLLASGGTYFKISRYVGTEYNGDILAIYVSNGAPCQLNQPDSTGLVVSWYITFNAAHLSDFSLIVATIWDNWWTDTWWNTSPSGGGGGGWMLQKDMCADQRDCSDSYYDRICGPCKKTLLDKVVSVFRGDTTAPSVKNSPYSYELNRAYLWAYDNGITTTQTIQKANMTWELLRSHMAKMISQFATKILGKTPDTTKTCTFKDMKWETSEMISYATTACQLGLMWYAANGVKQNATFNPKQVVDRAQFGTILSRLLWWDENAIGYPYYKHHLAALQDAGIMKNISAPLVPELRGYVMLMLMRAEQN